MTKTALTDIRGCGHLGFGRSVLKVWGFGHWGFCFCIGHSGVLDIRGFYRTQVSLGSDLWVLMSVTDYIQHYFADLNDVTLADEDSNFIPTDDVNRAILVNVAMQVAPSDGQH